MSGAPPIPATDRIDAEVKEVIEPMKETVERMAGRLPKQAKLPRLGANATSAEVARVVNLIADRLEGL